MKYYTHRIAVSESGWAPNECRLWIKFPAEMPYKNNDWCVDK